MVSRRNLLISSGTLAAVGAFSLLTQKPAKPSINPPVNPPIKPTSVKSSVELSVNPFGNAWGERISANGSIPVATSSLWSLTAGSRWVDDTFIASPEFWNFHRTASSPYHFDESIAKLKEDMPQFRAVKRAFTEAGISKTFIGYIVVNFTEGKEMPGLDDADESYFLHKAGEAETPENRVFFEESGALQASGSIIDIRNPAARKFFAKRIVAAMVKNDLDSILLDYAASQFAFGSRIADRMPPGWFKRFEENQYAYIREISREAERYGRKVFCNGLTLDGLWETKPEKAALWLGACHGAFWEQPFRSEWRDRGEGPDSYYDRLSAFFSLAKKMNKTIVIKQGTYRYHGTEEDNPGWKWRYQITNERKERQLAEFHLAFYLLFMQGELTPLIYTHPVSAFDIFASEAYFDIWSRDIGKPLKGRVKVADHVYARRFERAVVVLNNSSEPVEFARQLIAPMSGALLDVPQSPQ